MAGEDGPQVPPTAQGAQGPPGPQNPPPPQNPQIPLVPNTPQDLKQQKYHNNLHHMCHYEIGPISNPNFLENQMKMQLIYLGQTIG